MPVIHNQDHQVSIQASTTIHEVAKAAKELAEGLSVDRLSEHYAVEFEFAAHIIRKRMGKGGDPPVSFLRLNSRFHMHPRHDEHTLYHDDCVDCYAEWRIQRPLK